MPQNENENPLAQFQDKKHVSIKTFRKNGEAVPTPVWFVKNEGKLYICTGEGTFKVKRIKNNPKVQAAPCTSAGEVMGEYFDATAHILSDAESKPVSKLFRKKYRIFRIWRYFSRIGKGGKKIFLEINPSK